VVSVVASVVFACSSATTEEEKTTAPAGATPEELFRALQPELIKTCGGVGGACHVKGTYKNKQGEAAALWLGPDDAYTAATKYPGIIPITGDPGDSKLLTQIEHDGPALVSVPDLFENVKVWVTAETAAAGSSHPVTDAFYIKDGPNVVRLPTPAPDGAQLTFDASTAGTNVFLDNMKVTAPAASGLAIETPTFVILPAKGPVQIDTLAGFQGKLSVLPGETKALYNGSTVLQNWNALNRVKIVFQSLALSTVPDAAPPTGCKAVDRFTSLAGPAFKADLGDGQSCVACHGVNGAPDSIEDLAVQAFDLRTLDADPNVACAETFSHITIGNKPQSPIILTCTGASGGDQTHPVRGVCGQVIDSGTDAAVPQCVPQSVIDGILGWINAE
jgi:hypothetical protein